MTNILALDPAQRCGYAHSAGHHVGIIKQAEEVVVHFRGSNPKRPSGEGALMANSQPSYRNARSQRHSHNFVDLTGKVFGRWTVIAYHGRYNPPSGERGGSAWECRCECGVIGIVRAESLKSGSSKSCGCLQSENIALRNVKNTTHGQAGSSRSREYVSWSQMINRCDNPKAKGYKNYGGRGITVCEKWRSFEAFFADMGQRPTPKHSIERKDTNGNYEPSNCRWATSVEQANNRRRNRLITYDGRTQTLMQWSRETGLTFSALKLRLKAGWSIGRAFTTPLRGARSK